jgi:hypothetical protein
MYDSPGLSIINRHLSLMIFLLVGSHGKGCDRIIREPKYNRQNWSYLQAPASSGYTDPERLLCFDPTHTSLANGQRESRQQRRWVALYSALPRCNFLVFAPSCAGDSATETDGTNFCKLPS